MEKIKGHKVFVARQSPRSYPQTKQQALFSEAIKQCGIVKGISRKNLIDKMVNCLPEFWEKHKGSE